MQSFHTDAAPQAIGPYVQAVACNGFVFLSGQTPLVPETMQLAGDDIETQARQVLANLGAILKEAGLTPADVVQCRVYLTDMAEFQAMNAIYAAFFGDHKPARTTIQAAALPMGAKVEIECMAVQT